ncbi:MAG: hypothetical protein GX909_03075, partial [Clostridiaceae bacterium]|nr:hypothetical protein [Clostridiaceae bacterium]
MILDTPLIFDLPQSGDKKNRMIRDCDVEKPDFKAYYQDNSLNELPDIPDLAEIQVVRHFTNMSAKHFG